MNCHQILSGACNAGDRCFAVGSVEGVSFTAYAAGCNIVILASTFERVQIIPGAVHNYIRISALDCSTDTGKIAAAYEGKVCIFEPTPLIHSAHPPAHGLEYKWVQTGTLHASSHISSLSWNLEGTRLLTGGTVLEMWHENIKDDSEPVNVKFEIGGADPRTPNNEQDTAESQDQTWECVWKCHTAAPVHHMTFSPDGTLFATSGKSDRLVKVWYENKQLLFPSKSLEATQSMGSFLGHFSELSYGFVYVAHPRAVTHISWRKTSKYMPKGSVANMLVTSCLDNICRIWVETVLPDDGLVNMNQFDPQASQNPKFRTHRHKHRFMQRLKHMKTCFHIRRNAKHQHGVFPPNGYGQPPIPTLPSTFSVHDFHTYGFHGTGVTPGLHFHLAASINAETDIPLVPSMQTNDPAQQPNFVLHWLNNKEMHFSLHAENLLQEMTKKMVEKEDLLSGDASHHSEHSDDRHSGVAPDEIKRKLNKINKSVSHDGESQHSDEHPHQNRSHSIGAGSHAAPPSHTLSNTTSIQSLMTDGQTAGHGVPHPHNGTDSLDMKIDSLLRDWHHNPDLLFSIHPIDGSFLIWVIEWLDEYNPGAFRQALVSFSTRIPSAFPLGDAMSMSTTVSLYSTGINFLRDIVTKKSGPGSTTTKDNSTKETVDGDTGTPLPMVQEEQDAEEGTENAEKAETTSNKQSAAADSGNNAEPQHGTDVLVAPPPPTISMVTKHANGTLNLWELTFADKSKFSQVLSIGHASRASGHRFRVNDITCHPVLPLLLTTSHHNIPELTNGDGTAPRYTADKFARGKDVCVPLGFCSELILWRVDAVGPLSQSGGVSELARINSPEISAFSNVAWIPTLLPSTTLGNLSNSPSACFVASDGESLRVYQAVIDARTLLAEISSSERRQRMMSDSMMTISDASSMNDAMLHHSALHDKIKIVSQQSTARPGCIIQLDAITDATHDWQNTQLLHVFQEQLITGERNESDFVGLIDNKGMDGGDAINGLMEKELDAMVDLQRNSVFEEPFYIVIFERTLTGTTVHMWRIVIASQPIHDELTGSMMYVPDSNIVQDLDEDAMNNTGARRHSVPGLDEHLKAHHGNDYSPHVNISTTKVCTQELPLPDGVDVVHAAPAAGHLSSSSIYPACFAPYIIVTACSDSHVRFWKCQVTKNKNDSSPAKFKYEWKEWEMVRKDMESSIDINGQLLHVSAAYNGRIACAYKYGKSFTRPNKPDPESRYVNLCVAIYECESTGGSEWVLEDTIHLKNIHLPRVQMDPHLDLSYLTDQKSLLRKQKLQQVLHPFANDDHIRSPLKPVAGSSNSINGGDITPDPLKTPGGGLTAVPSFSTLQSLRKSITDHGNTCPLTQKHLVQLDWVSKEDGSHILTVAVGSRIKLFTPVSSDIAQANMKAMKESQTANRPLLRKASSLARPHFQDEIRWMKVRQIELKTADGLPPLPMQISWVRDGIFVAGMDSEMHVYSQWKPRDFEQILLHHLESVENFNDSRCLKDEDLRSLVTESNQRRLGNVPSMPRISTTNLPLFGAQDKKKKGQANGSDVPVVNHDYMTDFGLFEASRIACPVLPQYHPKQLMELLNSGKIRWVKAILAHLVRCIGGSAHVRGGTTNDEESLSRQQRGWSRSRTFSVSYAAGTNSPLEPRGSTTQIPEELTLDYAEITSIPPLPLWTLLAADKETISQQQKEEVKDYNELFESNVAEDNLDDLLEDDPESPCRFDRRQSVGQNERLYLSHFGPRQGQLLSRLLTHTHLPGLSSLDQMHLLALADTVSTVNTELAERFAIDAAKTAIAKENLTGNPGDSEHVSTDSLDDCGLRFLMAMKHFTYLLRCLPLAQRAQFQKQGVGTANIVWAFHSESEEEMLGLVPNYSKGQIKWHQLKELGFGWWCQSQTLLRTCVEKLAKAAFQSKQDPLDAAIYYMAMKKKSVVWGLFRNKRDDKMTAFFQNNFNDDRWRKAALKNAFALLGKQRFDHAVAFFLLAGSLNDALEVCLTKLEDLQLALLITRLYEGEHDNTPPSFKRLIYEEILGCDKNGENQDWERAHPDPFLRSMALWILKDYAGSLSTLMQNDVGILHKAYDDDDPSQFHGATRSANPNVFNFYVYLRTHPLLIRQHLTTAQEKKRTQVVLSGFSFGGQASVDGPQNGKIKSSTMATDKQLHLEDSITPLERQLYFTTAHGHFKAGCPALALEVLSKLPTIVIEEKTASEADNESVSTDRKDNNLIETGTFDWSGPVKGGSTTSGLGFDNSGSFDWGAPVTSTVDEGFKLVWDEEEKEDEEDEDDDGLGMKIDATKKSQETQDNTKATTSDNKLDDKQTGQLDIMAQQLKFIACLKILMEELSTLATGFEVDGGQLRYQLYVWLEREVEALKQLCNYSNDNVNISIGEDYVNESTHETPLMKDKFQHGADRPTLHEILLQEKHDFEAKVHRAAKRKRWLKANETLLRTLLSYCSLHGASGGGLASVRMELVLLLQELQQEKTQQQLLSPLPFPTTLPLLSACVAGNKTVVADPIRYLQQHTHDMLQTVVEIRSPPSGLLGHSGEIFILRDLAVALSACIYQSLCDSDTFSVKQLGTSECHSPGMETIARLNASCQSTHLMANAAASGRRRRYSTDEPLSVCTPPPKWPGVTNLRALLAREKDEDTPRLNVLLCEAFCATFMALLVYGLTTCDCHILYRLVGQQFTDSSWALLFGGGVKKLLRKATSHVQAAQQMVQQQLTQQDSAEGESAAADTGVWTSITKHRVKLNMKILGQFSSQQSSSNMKEDKPTYREQFVPPEMSMVSYFLTKPAPLGEPTDDDYDSADSAVSDLDEDEDDEDVFGDPLKDDPKKPKKSRRENVEHLNPNSMSWLILRAAIIKHAQLQVNAFITVAGLETQELPVCSPLIHGTLRTLAIWLDLLKEELDHRGPASADFIPGCFVESENKGPAIHKYRSLLEKSNTPFNSYAASSAPTRRLWNYMVRQEEVQEIFIRAIFGKRKTFAFESSTAGHPQSPTASASVVDFSSHSDVGGINFVTQKEHSCQQFVEPVRIIHKDQESISAFCINLTNSGMLALATPRELQEIDISLLLESPHWLEDECEFDIMNLSKDVETIPSSGFLVIQSSNQDKNAAQNNIQNLQQSQMPTSPHPGQTGRGASVIKGAVFPGSHDPRYCKFIIDRSKHLLRPVLKHKVDNIKRMSSHPLMPLYLTGSQDGSVQMWEWGHQQSVCTPRPSGTFAKVTRCRFSQHGNKFGVADGDGKLSLWQVGLASQSNRSFFNHECHNKLLADFMFIGSCSLVATAGHSSESKNVAMWDTLLPQKKSMIASFACHDQGASCLTYAPQHQLIISAGKKGDVCIFDMRQRTLRHRFQAHDNGIKCIAMDPHEEIFVTGSADGDIKVWALAAPMNQPLFYYPGEHKHSSFFKHLGQGVTQIHIDQLGRMFSCGVDGSMKVRSLPDRDTIVNSIY